VHAPHAEAAAGGGQEAKALGIVIAASTDGSHDDGEDSARVRVAHDMEELVACEFTPL
jgi:hypothetical protein